MTVAPIAGAMADRIGERPLMVAGLSLQAIGMAWLALIAEPGMAYSQNARAFHRRRSRHLDGDPRRAELRRRLGREGGDRQGGRRQQHDARARRRLRIAVVVAVFAGAGSYASAQAFIDGFGPAIVVAAGLALAGATAGLALPSRRRTAAAPSARSPHSRRRE